MHDDGVGRGAAQAGRGHAEALEVFARRREEAAPHALGLHAEQHDDVGPRDRVFDRRGGAHAELRHLRQHQRGRPAPADFGAEGPQQPQVRPEHPAVQQVADDRDPEPLEPALAIADGERVEQGLRGVLVHAVAGVDDAGPAQPRGQVSGPGGLVPEDDDVGGHRLEVAQRVGQGLALRDARPGGRDVDGVGAQALLGDLERGAGAGARLEEQVHDGVPAQGRHLLDRPRADLLHGLGGVENQQDLVGRQVADAQQVLGAEAGRLVEPQPRFGGPARRFSRLGHRR